VVLDLSTSEANDRQKAVDMNLTAVGAYTWAITTNVAAGMVSQSMAADWPGGLACKIKDALYNKFKPKDTMSYVDLRHDLNAIAMKKNEDPSGLDSLIRSVILRTDTTLMHTRLMNISCRQQYWKHHRMPIRVYWLRSADRRETRAQLRTCKKQCKIYGETLAARKKEVKTTLISHWEHLEVIATTMEQVDTWSRISVSPRRTMAAAEVTVEATRSRVSATTVECVAIWQRNVLRMRRMQANVPMAGSPRKNMAM
jgi:hypothetical protein